MERYKNLSGNSGIIAFEAGDGSITIEFRNGDRYPYTGASAGRENIRQMRSSPGAARVWRALSTMLCASGMRADCIEQPG